MWGWGGDLPTSPTNSSIDTNLVSYNSAQFWCLSNQRQHQTPQLKGSLVPDSPPSCFRCQVQGQVAIWTLTKGLHIRLSYDSSLGSINLLEQLTELRKPIYSLDYQRHSLQIPTCSSTWKVSNSVLWVFMEASWPRHEWLNHWQLVTESNLKPLSSPPRGWDCKFQTSRHKAGPSGNPPPSLGAAQWSPH